MLVTAILLEAIKVLAPVLSILVAASAILQTLERGRRELAVSLIYDWAKDTDWATSRSITILKELPASVIDEIDQKRATRIPASEYEAVVGILRAEFPENSLPPIPTDTAGDFAISREQSAFIRYLWVRWLNRLEGVLAAWLQGAAAPELMHEEFSPLVNGRRAELDMLKHVRNGLPVIDEFFKRASGSGGISVRPKLGVFPWHS